MSYPIVFSRGNMRPIRAVSRALYVRKTSTYRACRYRAYLRAVAVGAMACATSACITGGTQKALWTGEQLGAYHYIAPTEVSDADIRGIGDGEFYHYQ